VSKITDPAPGETPALSIRNLSKRFGGALALDQVSLDVAAGEVHGLLGQNGSGKSTLIRVLSGFHVPEPGAEIEVYGRRMDLPIDTTDPSRRRIVFVHQNLGLIPSLSVLENLRLEEFAAKTKAFIDWPAETRRARDDFDRFGLKIDPRRRLSDLRQVERAMVAIVRAFCSLNAVAADGQGAGIMVLDEPTPFLPRDGVEQLFSLIRSIKAKGASVIFVSHDIDEVVEITDRVTVLRDGQVSGTLRSSEASHSAYVELIIGRKVELYQTRYRDLSDKPIVARLLGLRGNIVRNVDITLREGEVVGLTGLIGSGFDEVPYLVFGAVRAEAGTVEIAGASNPAKTMTPHAAIAKGLALLPADRLARAGVADLSATDNLTLPILSRFRAALGLDWPAMRTWSAGQCAIYEVRPNRPDFELRNFSGGNQQKVLMAKWLQNHPSLLMLDEPTQGVDVGARQKIFEALDAAKAKGTAILCASSDAEQLAQLCDRVLVFSRGAVIAELKGSEISKDAITERCLQSASLHTNKILQEIPT
jgi:ribose transport system ATP-binding protein